MAAVDWHLRARVTRRRSVNMVMTANDETVKTQQVVLTSALCMLYSSESQCGVTNIQSVFKQLTTVS